MSTGERVTKAERKEEARLEREAIHRQMAKRRRTRTVVLVLAVVAAVVAIGAAVLSSSGKDDQASGTPSGLPGMMTSTAPWGPNTDDLGARLSALGLPGVSEEILHHHTRLEIYVNGQPVEVPANIGWNEPARVVSPLHTHDTSGTVHTESDDPNFTTDLGTLFDVWGLRLAEDCLGAYCTEGNKQVRVFVDGEPVEGDPRDVPVDDLSVVVVAYGTPDELPDPVPSSFVPEG